MTIGGNEMGKHVLQIPSDDGCIYIYDVDTQTLRKLCGITASYLIPDDVKQTLERASLPVKTRDEG
jgi:hypothetical protein